MRCLQVLLCVGFDVMYLCFIRNAVNVSQDLIFMLFSAVNFIVFYTQYCTNVCRPRKCASVVSQKCANFG